MWYKEKDNQLWEPPTNFFTEDGWIINFNKNPEAMTAHGWRDWTDAEIAAWQAAHPAPQPDRTAFEEACKAFREVCALIGEQMSCDFRGGFDDMVAYSAHPVSDTLAGVKLAVAWSAANELCVYEAKKIGIGQPDWWYECWKEA